MPHPVVNFILTHMETLREFSARMDEVENSGVDPIPRGGPHTQFYDYLDQQLNQLDLEIPKELMWDTRRYFLEMGLREVYQLLCPMVEARNLDEPMTPEAKELLDRDLSTYDGIAWYLNRKRLKIKIKLETATPDNPTELWTELAKVNAVSQGLLYLTGKLYDVFLESEDAMSPPIEEDE